MWSRRRAEGFTFLELLIVVLLISAFAGAVLPRLGGGFRFRLRDAGRELSAELGYAAQRAVATGRFQQWVVDLDAQRFRLEELQQSDVEPVIELPTHSELLDLAPPLPDAEYVPVPNRTGEWRRLETDEVMIDEIRLGDRGLREGLVALAFAPDGGADPATIWLLDENGSELRIRIAGFTGELRVDDDVTRE
ncbi:MAG: prepilin-type N-terminal cleavage/methylation domain-containing protein [Myxococcota bacterium]